MSFFHGLGMFIFGMGCTLVGAIIAFYIINKVMEEKKEAKLMAVIVVLIYTLALGYYVS